MRAMTRMEVSSRSLVGLVFALSPSLSAGCSGARDAAPSVAITTDAVHLVPGGSYRFRAVADGAPVAGTWSVEGGGSIDGDGVFVAPATLGTSTIFVAAAGARASSRAFVVAPPPAVLLGTAQAFTIASPNGIVEMRLIDFDSDGDLDVIRGIGAYPPAPGPLQALRNDGGVFVDATATVLVNPGQVFHPRDFSIADFNGDGRDDVFIADHGADQSPFPGGQSRLLIQSAAGQLLDETATRLPAQQAFTHNICHSDVDADGDLDLYLSNVFNDTGNGPRIYRNDGSGFFVTSADSLPAAYENLTFAFTACEFIDVDRDGDDDLVLGAMQDQVPQDRLLLNDGTGTFVVTDLASLPARHGGPDWTSIDVSKADFDRDGWMDLVLVTNDFLQQPGLQLLLNDTLGGFVDATDRLPFTSSADATEFIWAKPVDLTGEGWTDVVASGNGLTPRLFRHTGVAFEDVTPFTPNGPRIHPGDIDGDGDEDLFLDRFGSSFAVIWNQRIP